MSGIVRHSRVTYQVRVKLGVVEEGHVAGHGEGAKRNIFSSDPSYQDLVLYVLIM